jgi:aminopeptidase
MEELSQFQQAYADLVIRTGVNLQPGQCLRIGGELEHAPFVRLLAAAAYRAGAPYVVVDWVDAPLARARLTQSDMALLDYFPEFEVQKHRQMVEERWARVALVGSEFPEIFNDVAPGAMRTVAVTRSQKLKFYMQAMMANKVQWCVAAVPTTAWAQRVFPALSAPDALEKLWRVILQTCRVDQPDPDAAWQNHDATLARVVDFLMHNDVRRLHFVETSARADGAPVTDLTIGMTDRPKWLGGSAQRPDGVRFFPNMPTEESFSTPHRGRAEGFVRLSKPAYPFQREVRDAWFRFEGGEVVEYGAASGREVLEQFFELDGTRRLGEVALVDVRSPVSQADVVFYEILFDENAACHIAFGEAYPGGVVDGDALPEEELRGLGVNKADAHLDVMIGTPTMRLTGLCADGREVLIMKHGQFVPEITEGVTP